jgi:hypothetical protein
MIKDQSDSKPEINLRGPEGNAFVLLGYAKRYAKDLNLDFKEIQEEMMKGSYENLIEVFDKYFGEYVDLIR